MGMDTCHSAICHNVVYLDDNAVLTQANANTPLMTLPHGWIHRGQKNGGKIIADILEKRGKNGP